MKIPSLEEKLAIARLKQGDLDGMEPLVRRHQARAVSVAFLIVRNPKLAEDIVQDTFPCVAEKIDQFDENQPFGPWFLRSVINTSIKAARRQKRFVSMDGAGRVLGNSVEHGQDDSTSARGERL